MHLWDHSINPNRLAFRAAIEMAFSGLVVFGSLAKERSIISSHVPQHSLWNCYFRVTHDDDVERKKCGKKVDVRFWCGDGVETRRNNLGIFREYSGNIPGIY